MDSGFHFLRTHDIFLYYNSLGPGSVVHAASYQVNIVRAFSEGRAARKVV
jgi:hypothetical protein